MENIRQAIERARTLKIAPPEQRDGAAIFELGVGTYKAGEMRGRQIELKLRRLEANRIIAYDDRDVRSKSFDMLRTQVLQSMDQKNWKILGVTSPTPGCGKTVTAINLAFSIARRQERPVLLVDVDLQKPQVASYMGLSCAEGLISVLEGRSSLSNAIIRAKAAKCLLPILPAECSVSRSSAWTGSRAMTAMLQAIRRDYRSHIVVLDLPPVLSSDDVVALLPQLDCVLLIAAVARSTVAEVEECDKYLHSAAVVRLVLNKVPEVTVKYYGSRY